MAAAAAGVAADAWAGAASPPLALVSTGATGAAGAIGARAGGSRLGFGASTPWPKSSCSSGAVAPPVTASAPPATGAGAAGPRAARVGEAVLRRMSAVVAPASAPRLELFAAPAPA
ncbi:MAG TPA: hypothetical protein VG474_03430, partial [Solirubrobacteraceae bacterium]|nr:hypothetical protein [Solirubrobacteraceae bacterium]